MGIGAILFLDPFASASWSNRGPRTTKGTLRLLRRISFGAAAMFTLTLLIWEDLALLSWPVILMIATADGWKCSIKESPEHFAPGVSRPGKIMSYDLFLFEQRPGEGPAEAIERLFYDESEEMPVRS